MRRKQSIRGRAAAGVALCGGLLLLLSAAALPPAANALGSKFSINDGAAYSRYSRVTVGDGGWSPFFEPGVVVWDGGSIIAGHGADPGYEFPAQTLGLVPRVCTSSVSATGSAVIADMIADAPREVDALHGDYADLNLCLVHAGGGDFRRNAGVDYVHGSLQEFCQGRRAAGFTVVVLTVLPSSVPATFEASRQAFNDLVRDTWPSFADGIVDIAADPRIGDPLDNLDQKFYQADALHLNNAGNAVMAGVAAPVVNALAWRSATCEMRVRDAGLAWSAWRPYVARSTWEFPVGDGPRTVEAEYRDGFGASVVVWDSIRVDTVRPTTVALKSVRVRKNKKAKLPYRVVDPQPCGPTATVVVTVTNRAGAKVKTFTRRKVPIAVAQSVSFVCRLPKGAYRYAVTARDTAGNPQSVIGSARLIVR